jgi:glyoxylate carboligase
MAHACDDAGVLSRVTPCCSHLQHRNLVRVIKNAEQAKVVASGGISANADAHWDFS